MMELRTDFRGEAFLYPTREIQDALLAPHHVARVRKHRRFKMDLTPPTVPTSVVKADQFASLFATYLRPLLAHFERCDMFWFETDATLDRYARFRAGARTKEHIQDRIGAWPEWEAAGVEPERWLQDYLRRRPIAPGAEEAERAEPAYELELESGARDDVLFWWWLCYGTSWAPKPVFRLQYHEASWRDFVAPLYDPRFVGGDKTARQETVRRYARRVSSRTHWVLWYPYQLSLTFVASAADIEPMYRAALEHATITSRLAHHARAGQPPPALG